MDTESLRALATSFWGGAVVVVSVGFAATSRLTSFREDVLIPKLINRYRRLRSSVDKGSSLSGSIRLATEEEAFRVLFGHRGPLGYRRAFLKLHGTGEFTAHELRQAGTILDVREGRIVSTYGWFERTGIVIHVALLSLVSVVFASHLAAAISDGTLGAWIAAGIILAVFAGICVLLLSELFRLLSCRKVARKLEAKASRKARKREAQRASATGPGRAAVRDERAGERPPWYERARP